MVTSAQFVVRSAAAALITCALSALALWGVPIDAQERNAEGHLIVEPQGTRIEVPGSDCAVYVLSITPESLPDPSLPYQTPTEDTSPQGVSDGREVSNTVRQILAKSDDNHPPEGDSTIPGPKKEELRKKVLKGCERFKTKHVQIYVTRDNTRSKARGKPAATPRWFGVDERGQPRPLGANYMWLDMGTIEALARRIESRSPEHPRSRGALSRAVSVFGVTVIPHEFTHLAYGDEDPIRVVTDANGRPRRDREGRIIFEPIWGVKGHAVENENTVMKDLGISYVREAYVDKVDNRPGISLTVDGVPLFLPTGPVEAKREGESDFCCEAAHEDDIDFDKIPVLRDAPSATLTVPGAESGVVRLGPGKEPAPEAFLLGRVSTAGNDPVSFATITATDQSTKASRATVSTDTGDYRLPLPPGTYTIEFKSVGYSTVVRKDVVVGGGDPVRQNVQLGAEAIELSKLVVSETGPPKGSASAGATAAITCTPAPGGPYTPPGPKPFFFTTCQTSGGGEIALNPNEQGLHAVRHSDGPAADERALWNNILRSGRYAQLQLDRPIADVSAGALPPFDSKVQRAGISASAYAENVVVVADAAPARPAGMPGMLRTLLPAAVLSGPPLNSLMAAPNASPVSGSRRGTTAIVIEPAAQSTEGELKIFFVATGDMASGESFRMIALNGTGHRLVLHADLLVLKPLRGKTRADVEREARRSNGRRTEMLLPGFCLDKDKALPGENQVFAMASEAEQAAERSNRRILQASRLLDAQPDYFVTQWAVWAREKGYDERTFADALVQHTRTNAEAAGKRWTPDLDQKVRGLIPGAWRDIMRVVLHADALDQTLREPASQPR